MVNNCTSLKSSRCLGVTKLNPSNFMHFFKESLKRLRHTKWFHTCTISLMTSGFYSPATSDCVSFGLWCLKCFSKYFLSVTSYSQRVKVKQSKILPQLKVAPKLLALNLKNFINLEYLKQDYSNDFSRILQGNT